MSMAIHGFTRQHAVPRSEHTVLLQSDTGRELSWGLGVFLPEVLGLHYGVLSLHQGSLSALRCGAGFGDVAYSERIDQRPVFAMD